MGLELDSRSSLDFPLDTLVLLNIAHTTLRDAFHLPIRNPDFSLSEMKDESVTSEMRAVGERSLFHCFSLS